MKWKKFTIETTTNAVDLVSGMLYELGIDGIEIVDKVPLSEEDKKKMFIDIVPELGFDDGIAQVHFYLDDEVDEESIFEKLDQIQNGLSELTDYMSSDTAVSRLMAIGSGVISRTETEDKDWINNWKEFFKPFRVDDTIVIKPTWEEWTDTDGTDLVIEIDPGTAFGTGSHETTKLCILNMKKYIKHGDTLLDLGCGSGILSIAARKLGAVKTVGTDIDSVAVTVSGENAKVNHLDKETCSFFLLDVIENADDQKKLRDMQPDGFDVVVANILADVIIPLSGVVSKFMKKGGYFISSGIINTKAKEVKDALNANGFTIAEEVIMGEWISYVAICNNR